MAPGVQLPEAASGDESSIMTKVRNIVAGLDTPQDHDPASVLAAMGLVPLTAA
jgi:hypothetical protein